jgi:3-oxoacyl-[acyl-carrier protein] reductase
MSLTGKVTMISGASRGIGRQIALTFAANGAYIVAGTRTPEAATGLMDEIKEHGGDGMHVPLDVADDQQVEAAVNHVVSSLGKIDILINCAGVILYDTPVWKTTIEEWDSMMRVNLRGTFLCCRSVVPHMIRQQSGTIINIASSSARMADDDLGPYTASKWGVAGYTTSLARSVRSHGIHVNGLNPGWVDTDMSRALTPEGDAEWSTASEIAGAAFYLATSAPRDMTGQFLDIFGS